MSSKKVLVSQREVDPEIRAGDVALVGSGIDVCEAGDTLTIGTSAAAVSFPVPVSFTAAPTGVIQKRVLTFGHADLTAAALSQALNLGAALPAGATIVGTPSVAVSAAFTDGAGATVTLDIGTAGDPNAIGTWDLDAAPIDGQAGAYTPGIAPGRLYAGATQLLATVTSDVNVDTLTAGAAVITVLFVMPA